MDRCLTQRESPHTRRIAAVLGTDPLGSPPAALRLSLCVWSDLRRLLAFIPDRSGPAKHHDMSAAIDHGPAHRSANERDPALLDNEIAPDLAVKLQPHAAPDHHVPADAAPKAVSRVAVMGPSICPSRLIIEGQPPCRC